MLLIDQYAYTNNLKLVSPAMKIIFSLLGLILSLSFSFYQIHLVILLTMIFVTTFIARIPFGFYLKMFSIPLFFILVSIISIVISFSYTKSDFIYSLAINKLYIGITEYSISNAFLILRRSLACLGSMYFLILTTPVNNIISLLAKLKFPAIVLEMSLLIYRFIFIFVEETNSIITAQTLRFGYTGLSNSYKSLSALITVLFTRIFIRYTSMKNALDCRCFSENFYLG